MIFTGSYISLKHETNLKKTFHFKQAKVIRETLRVRLSPSLPSATVQVYCLQQPPRTNVTAKSLCIHTARC